MRYVNLHKRNTSKFQYVSKRLATVSLLSLALLSVFVIPLTMKTSENKVDNNSQVIEENLGNEYIEVLNKEVFDEID